MLGRRWGNVLGAGLVAALAGCTSSLFVQQRMSREIGCPESSITVTELGAGGYRAEGCGQSLTYVCAGPPASPTCVKEGSAGAGATLQAADDQQRAQQRAAEQQQTRPYQPPTPPPAAVAPLTEAPEGGT